MNMSTRELKEVFNFESPEWERKFNFISADKWEPKFINGVPILKQEILFTNNKGAIIAPISTFYNPEAKVGEMDLDYFVTTTKKCYNSELMRKHTCLYLNYFENFYDKDKEYFSILAHMKHFIDYVPEYNIENIKYDIFRYILSDSILKKTSDMVEDNYSLSLVYKNISNPSLQYNDDHAKLLIQISILFNLCIPLLTHYAYMKKITDIDDFLLEIFDIIIYNPNFPINIYNKLSETSSTNVDKNQKSNPVIWNKQSIRGRNTTTHSMSSVTNIILNIMPKYVFDQNIVSMNYSSILNNTAFQITDIEYEYSYIPLSSSKRDEDDNSEFDKFEANLVKQNEALYLQNKMNSYQVMQVITDEFGPFDQQEFDLYFKEINVEYGINNFQKQLVFNLFYKYFGDNESIRGINKLDIAKLMISSKRILLNSNMLLLPYIVSGKVVKIVGRRSVNKKEMIKLEASPTYPLVVNKYKNEKIIKQILTIIATIISSEFEFIDYKNPDIHGKRIEIDPDLIIEEVLNYSLLI